MERCVPHLAAAYALAGLPAPRERSFARHALGCRPCRDEADALLEAASSLALAVRPVEPPPAPRERIVQAAGGGGS